MDDTKTCDLENSSSGVVYTQERVTSSAFIDSSVKLGIAQAVLMIQDNLTECFGALKCDGIIFRELGYFWVFTKSKVKFLRRPVWREKISASTFPVSASGMKTNVNTVIKNESGEILILANQEACVLDMERHRPVRLSDVPYPKENLPEAVFTDDFEKFSIPAEEYSEVYTQKIRSQNIDMSHHMNNIEYIKFALNIFDDDFLLSHEADELEVHYLGESKEGQNLKIMKAQDGGNSRDTFIKILEEESGRCVFEMKINFKD